MSVLIDKSSPAPPDAGIPVSPEVFEVRAEVVKGNKAFAIYKLDKERMVVVASQDPSKGSFESEVYAAFLKQLAVEKEARFGTINFKPKDEEKTTPLEFYWCDEKAPPKVKMVASTSFLPLMKKLGTKSYVEAHDAKELEYANVMGNVQATATVK